MIVGIFGFALAWLAVLVGWESLQESYLKKLKRERERARGYENIQSFTIYTEAMIWYCVTWPPPLISCFTLYTPWKKGPCYEVKLIFCILEFAYCYLVWNCKYRDNWGDHFIWMRGDSKWRGRIAKNLAQKVTRHSVSTVLFRDQLFWVINEIIKILTWWS